MDNLIKKRKGLKGRLTRIVNFVDAADPLTTKKEEYVVRHDALEDVWEKFEETQSEIELLCATVAEEEVHEIERESFEDRYYAVKAKVKEFMDSTNSNSDPKMNSGSQQTKVISDIKLPKMDLPSFSGNLEDWISFHDLFTAMIDKNKLLSGAQKLQYLKASLKGDAASLISSIQVTDANFADAWDILLARYQNKREIVHAHLKRIVSQTPAQQESYVNLRKLMDTTVECVRALKVLKVTDLTDPLLVYLVTEKLDSESRRQWELSLKSDEVPSFMELCDFITIRARALAAAGESKPTNNNKSKDPRKGKGDQNKLTTQVHHATKSSCVLCGGDHSLMRCDKYIQMTVVERRGLLSKNSLCFNCLAANHRAADCPSKFNCKKCRERHHTLLHQPDNQVSNTPPSTESPTVATLFASGSGSNYQVLLSTAIIDVLNNHGQKVQCRALLDSASMASFVTENVVQKLGLRRQRTSVTISGLSQTGVGTSHGITHLKLYSRTRNFSTELETLILPKVTGTLPHSKCDLRAWSHIKGLDLADPSFHVPGPIDILLGADIFNKIMLDGRIPGLEDTPTANNSVFGWILSGRVSSTIPPSVTVHHAHVDLDSTLRKFWELEDLPLVSPLTPSERQCEEHFVSTYSRDSTGRFVVQLPFKENSPDLGYSRDMAVRRFAQVERRLDRNLDFREQYNTFMKEYHDLGHMGLINHMDTELKSCKSYTYIPHHFVLKSSSTTTKFRVVFDASAKTSSGVSLNDKLLVGPKLQDDIFPLLVRFRTHPIALTADIAKMYRQIRLQGEQTNFQRIVWRDSPSKPLQDFRLLTVTYGTASAPFTATRCLQKLAEDNQDSFPLAAAIAARDFYVDDLMSGSHDRATALTLQRELIELMESGGFKLRKWSSNDPALLKSIPPEYRETQLPLQFDRDDAIKTLGIRWNPATDQFSFAVIPPPTRDSVTKRSLLSDLAKVFDPLGWLSPVTIKAKILFQDLWRLTLDWDDILPDHLSSDWTNYCQALTSIEVIQIPRYISANHFKRLELHGFSDSSEKAYSAVVYLRSILHDGQVKVAMITGKTKVAPIKQVSLPRLELQGALLLSRVMTTVQKSLLLPINDLHAWTDSKIVLDWLASHSSRWKTFIANRVAEIQNLISPSQWHHVCSKDNPADCASRGISPEELKDHTLWWNGPSWLSQPQLPFNHQIYSTEGALLEEKKPTTVNHVTVDLTLLHQFSSLLKLKRVTAYVQRFIYNTRSSRQQRRIGQLSTSELQEALLYWIKVIQAQEFHLEINSLKGKIQKPITTRLRFLNPYLDTNGILRVGGRLQQSLLPESGKHPILLPKKHNLTNLIISHYHLMNLHAGPQLLLALLREQFWILCGRDVVRRFVQQCIKCHRLRAITASQFMGNLPLPRVNQARPFIQCGVDYAGPFFLRVLKGRGQKHFKGYVAVFVCFSTHAVHLELVSDSTSDAFLAALKRFISRRGKCNDIFSDQGTNLVGANNELKEFLKILKSDSHNNQTSNFLSNQGITWHFNAPAAPHAGGLWEAAVKSTKYHLRRTVGLTALNFEEMATLLCQIEACLNSRPIMPMSSDPSDLSALTPGHFLIGQPLLAIPEPDYTELKENRLSRFQLVQQLSQHFWKRWSTEYLHQLQQLPKWLSIKPNLKVNDLVLIKEDNVPPLQWRLGRILLVHPGKDNCVRVATVKTAVGEVKRPIVKLSLLPID